MKVLIACEYSGIVRDAFLRAGHEAISCDLLPTESAGPHYQGDVKEAILLKRWDLIIIHIPCTGMALCGNRTYGKGKPKHAERLAAVEWSLSVWALACSMADAVALENPASVVFPALKARYGANVQHIQPWQFGHAEMKKTGLALFRLPALTGTENVYKQMMELPRAERERVFFMPPGANRAKERARFYPGIAAAMAAQWGTQNRTARPAVQCRLQFT